MIQSENATKHQFAKTSSRADGVVSSVASRFAVFAVTLTYYILLFHLFCNEITTYSLSYPLYHIDIDWGKATVGAAAAGFGSVFLPRSANPKSLFFVAVYFLMIVPRLVLMGAQNGIWSYPLLCFAVFWLAVILSSGFKPLDIHSDRLDKSFSLLYRVLPAVIAITVVATIAYLLNVRGIPTARAFDFNLTYELRALNSYSPIGSLVISMLGINLLPLALAYCLSQDNIKVAAFVTLAELLLFLWTANKSWLLMIVLIWATYGLLKRGRHFVAAFLAIPFIVALVAVFAVVVDNVVSDWAVSLFVRRLIVVPSGLGFAYYDFFQSNPPVLFAGTVFSKLTPLPAEYASFSYPVQIGALYCGGAYANTGMFGSEFAHFGLVGWCILVINICITAKLLSCREEEKDFGFMSMVGFVFAFQLLNASTVSLLFSLSGVVEIAVLLLFKMNAQEKWKEGAKELVAARGHVR